jgi:hypothetical protein
MYNQIAQDLLGTVKVDADRSRIELGGKEVAYHCDKFATRIIKGLEDVLGVEKATELLVHSAAQTTYDMLSAFVATEPTWGKLDVAGKLAAIFDIYKLQGYGAVVPEKMDGTSTAVASDSSYLAEGFFENMQRWGWMMRQKPFCHDMCGYLQAAFALSTGKDLSAVKVTEAQCRAAGSARCVFDVEVS